MTNREIIDAIEEFSPLHLQEEWDNSGWQVGSPDAACSGVLLCVDVTPAMINEAAQCGCNLIITHHPLIFKGVRTIIGRNRTERCIALALQKGISVYSSHTATDCAPAGVSYEMAKMLGLEDLEVLDTATGLGYVGNLPAALTSDQLVNKVKQTFGAEVVRTSREPYAPYIVKRVALCGGSAGEFLPLAIAKGAQAYITADCKHNLFLDHADDILLLDSGHFETEQCTKEIFYSIISQKFPNFAVWKSTVEKNPVLYR